MNENEYLERVKRLQEVNGVISKLDGAIRGAAFQILESYITGSKAKSSKDGDGNDNPEGMEEFFAKADDKKPSDNAFLVVAYHYSQYGNAPISYEEVKATAENVGIIIPGRVDATFKAAADKGKKLFQSGGRGKIKPTVHGEQYLKETFGVKKGKNNKMDEEVAG